MGSLPDRPKLRRHRHRFRVIYGDTDMMGVVYYANYFRFFEAGRGALLRAAGVDYRSVEEAGLIFPVTSAFAKYHAPARYDDELTVELDIVEVRFASLRIRYRVVREIDDTLIATGETTHASVSKAGRISRLPENVRTALKEDDETG